ncbi:MAG: Rieske 2Fe-2S domain-containing protein [Gemmatimonadota bacterium]
MSPAGHSDEDRAFQHAALRSDIEPGLPLAVTLPDGRRVVLVQDGADVFAAADRCPHRDFPLSGGDVIAPCILECPWHGAQFDVRTGEVVQGPATDPLALYEVRIEGDDILVKPRS